jgi:hypothetical protein
MEAFWCIFCFQSAWCLICHLLPRAWTGTSSYRVGSFWTTWSLYFSCFFLLRVLPSFSYVVILGIKQPFKFFLVHWQLFLWDNRYCFLKKMEYSTPLMLYCKTEVFFGFCLLAVLWLYNPVCTIKYQLIYMGTIYNCSTFFSCIEKNVQDSLYYFTFQWMTYLLKPW